MRDLSLIEVSNHALGSAVSAGPTRPSRDQLPRVGTVEGLGLVIGLELVADKKERTRLPDSVVQGVISKALDHGLIIRARDGRLALCSPLIITEAEAGEMLDILYPLIRDMAA